MTQTTVNQRISFLIEKLGLSIRAFSATIGVSDTNTRNYLSKGTKPNSDYLAGIVRHFRRVSPAWLLLGEGEPFLDGAITAQVQAPTPDQKNATGPRGTDQSPAILSNCEKERDTYKVERDQARQEVAHLQAQLVTKDALIASKEETIAVLKAANRLS